MNRLEPYPLAPPPQGGERYEPTGALPPGPSPAGRGAV